MITGMLAAVVKPPAGVVRTSSVVTVTLTTRHPYEVGDKVTLDSVVPVGATVFDGTHVVASVPSETTFTFAQVAADDTGGAGTVNRGDSTTADGQQRIYIRPEGTAEAIIRYYKLLPDMSADTDVSGFPSHLEEALLYGAMKYLAEADRDGAWVNQWRTEYFNYLRPIHASEIHQADGFNYKRLVSAYEDKTLLFE